MALQSILSPPCRSIHNENRRRNRGKKRRCKELENIDHNNSYFSSALHIASFCANPGPDTINFISKPLEGSKRAPNGHWYQIAKRLAFYSCPNDDVVNLIRDILTTAVYDFEGSKRALDGHWYQIAERLAFYSCLNADVVNLIRDILTTAVYDKDSWYQVRKRLSFYHNLNPHTLKLIRFIDYNCYPPPSTQPEP